MMEETGKPLHVVLPPGWHERLKAIAAKEGRKIKDVIEFALQPIIKSGRTGMNGSNRGEKS